MLNTGVLEHTARELALLRMENDGKGALVELVNESSLYHFWLLRCSCGTNSLVGRIARVSSFRAIGVDCAAPVTIGTAVNRRAPRRPGRRRGYFHRAG